MSREYEEIEKSEGAIKFSLPIDEEKVQGKITKRMPVFYNETMTLNRDLTLLMVKIYSEIIGRKVTFLDTMAASGIRAMRLLKETEAVSKVYINDLNPVAIRYIKNNLALNSVPEENFELFNEDAIFLLERFRYTKSDDEEKLMNFCDVIDLDPFGSPSRFTPSAFHSIQLGGMMCITATDTPVLFGIRKEQCVRKYLTLPIKTEYLKEMGTRILIYYAMKIANLYELYIEPVLSLSSDHFVRIYLIVRKGISGVNENNKQCGHYLHCNKCGYRTTEKFNIKGQQSGQLRCPHCNEKLIKSGLVWMGNLHNTEYQKRLIEELKNHSKKDLPSFNRLGKFLNLSLEENEFPPYFYSIPKTADKIQSTFPSMAKLQELLQKEGFNSTRTHFDTAALKTDADISVINRILLENRNTENKE